MKMYQKLFIISFVFIAFLTFIGYTQASTLSQTSISLTQGQSSVIYSSNVSTFLYLSSNSNPNVANVSISGNNITVYANTTGNTTVIVCENGINTCNTIYVTVSGNSSQNLSLSQSSVSISVGQTTTVTAYNNYYNTGTVYVSSNSNSSVATAVATNNTISIYGNSAGSSTIIVCQNGNTNYCGTIYVSVTGGYIGGTGYNLLNSLGLKISSITLFKGNSITVSSSNPEGVYVSNNTNPSVVSTSYSSLNSTSGCEGNYQYNIITGQPCYNYNYNNYNNGYSTNNNVSITFTALSVGSNIITLCPNSNNSCSTIYVTVSR